jgi:hypothetical protein
MPQENPIQKHLNIKEIKEDVVVLKNGEVRAVLMATSINFALRSQEEQEAIIQRYQDFLNSLDFPVQIIITSRKFNINNYIRSLEEIQNKQENELLRIQTAEYINFVQALNEENNIMSESFYLVIPYSHPIVKKTGFIKKLLGKKENEAEKKEQDFQTIKASLWQRVEFVSSSLSRTGVRSALLKTNELIELFYRLYNPSAKEDLRLKEVKKTQEE